MENLPLGIKLLCVGLPTVFAVLALIVLSGLVLQRHVIPALERWAPEEVLLPRKQAGRQTIDLVPPEAEAAIHSAVNILTKGKYSVLKIDKRSS